MRCILQRLLEIPQEVADFLRNFCLRTGELKRDSSGCPIAAARQFTLWDSKAVPFTHPLTGVPAPLAGILILQ